MSSDHTMININHTLPPLDFPSPQNNKVNAVDHDDVDDEFSNSPPPPSSATPLRQLPPAAAAAVKPPPIDESRKLFQRLWTDEDEIELLQGFLDYNNQRLTTNQHHHDTTAFYDQIKRKLQLEFNRNQLVEKLRRLKKKFRNVVQKIESGKECVFKTPHDQATFEISKKIWGGVSGITENTPRISEFNDDEEGNVSFSPNSIGVDEKFNVRAKKRLRTGLSVGVGDEVGNVVEMRNVVEETMRSCLLPVFKELLGGVVSLSNGGRGVGGLAGLVSVPFGVGNGGGDLGDAGDEKWRKQNILELEVFSKRLELVQEQIKAQLEELRAKGT